MVTRNHPTSVGKTPRCGGLEVTPSCLDANTSRSLVSWLQLPTTLQQPVVDASIGLFYRSFRRFCMKKAPSLVDLGDMSDMAKYLEKHTVFPYYGALLAKAMLNKRSSHSKGKQHSTSCNSQVLGQTLKACQCLSLPRGLVGGK